MSSTVGIQIPDIQQIPESISGRFHFRLLDGYMHSKTGRFVRFSHVFGDQFFCHLSSFFTASQDHFKQRKNILLLIYL
jgi:hypothetical protein